MKPNFIVSSCGTSVLTNGASPEQRKLVNTYANATQANQIPQTEQQALRQCIEQSKTNLLNNEDNKEIAKLSAELNALLKFYKDMPPQSNDQHWLLCTDTWPGREAGKIIAQKLEKKWNVKAQVFSPQDLHTGSLDEFRLGLAELVKWCEENILPMRASHHVVFNLTGGFKSIQGFLQTLAPFYADETIYVFESGEELLRIPRLPIALQTEQMVKNHLVAFRRLAKDLAVEDVTGVPSLVLMKIDKQTCLSPWGELVWNQTQPILYEQKLWPSPRLC